MWSDHRICVWNAADGSLVHSLTGHDKPVWKFFAPEFSAMCSSFLLSPR